MQNGKNISSYTMRFHAVVFISFDFFLDFLKHLSTFYKFSVPSTCVSKEVKKPSV